MRDAVTERVWSVPLEAVQHPRLTNIETADVAIVGAGFSGLVAALDVTAAGRSVVVLEGSNLGSGASASGAGHVGPMLYGAKKGPEQICATLGEEMGARLNWLVAQSGRWLFDTIERHAISCEARRGYLCVFRSDKSLARAGATFERWRSFGGASSRLQRSELAGHIVASRYAGGFFLPDGGFVNPARLQAGLARAAVNAGVGLFVDSPVHAVSRSASGWSVRSDHGEVRSEQLLLATGASAPTFARELAPTVYSVPCGIAATDPLPDHGRAILPAGGPVADLDDPAIFAPAVTEDGRLLMSFLMTRDHADLKSTPNPARKRLERVFPHHQIPAFNSLSWGRIAVTPDGLPRLIRRDDGLVALTGCNGFGLTLGITAAREAARLLLGTRDEDLALPVGGPRPLPGAGFVPLIFKKALAPLANRLGR